MKILAGRRSCRTRFRDMWPTGARYHQPASRRGSIWEFDYLRQELAPPYAQTLSWPENNLSCRELNRGGMR